MHDIYMHDIYMHDIYIIVRYMISYSQSLGSSIKDVFKVPSCIFLDSILC